MKWKRERLPVLTCAFFAIGLHFQGGSSSSQGDLRETSEVERPAVYVARVLSVSAAERDAFVACLRQNELPAWQTMKRNGLLTDQSVFETTSLRLSTPGAPPWNLLLLSRLSPATTPDVFFEAEKRAWANKSRGVRCEDAHKVEVRRVEVLRSTPNSYYPGPAAGTRPPGAPTEFTVHYIVEYLAVRETPEALNEYRETMRRNIGPAVAQLIRENWLLNLIALETVSVRYAQPGLHGWNQIHVRGFFPERGTVPLDDFDGVLKRVNPQGGGTAGVFGRLDAIRTKPREDVARQLPELAVR